MKRFVLFATMSLALVMAVSAVAGDGPYQFTDGNHGMVYGGTATAKASRDTTFLVGGPNSFSGKFQDASGAAVWNGWTHMDVSAGSGQHWFVSSYNVPAGGGTKAMWCGQTYPNACAEGYGNDWNELLQFEWVCPNPALQTTVRLQCKYNNSSESGWDYFNIQVNQAGVWTNLRHVSGENANQTFDQTVTIRTTDYVGPNLNLVQLRLACTSDNNTSDMDCLLNTTGHTQVDDIFVTITHNSVVQHFDQTHEDGTCPYWTQVWDNVVGDFSKIWSGLQDVDPCFANVTPQVAFIDDGVVVPGTGGTTCVTWCYGPGGYIVNNTGGLAGDAFNIDNRIISPVLNWPASAAAAYMSFDVYSHEDHQAGVSPGIHYGWHVRSAVSPAALEFAPWRDRNFLYYGRGYVSVVQNVTDLLVPGRTVVQVSLECQEYPAFGYTGVDGTPAPYFDNVAVRAYPFGGPSFAARTIDLVNDNFPERGDIDLANLANNWVRFDMARVISPDADHYNNPGDSIIVDIGLPRSGSVLNNMPKMFVKMKANPLFNGVRVLPPNFTQSANMIDGWVYGDSTFNGTTPVPNRYEFDLPDSNFFFPGDVIHYYIEAKDNVAGDIGTSTLPGNIADFANFEGVYPYGGNSSFIVHALPTLTNVAGNQPRILFWNDALDRGGENEWNYALKNLGYLEGQQYDVFNTQGPSSGVGNGLGGRATSQTIGGYNTLLYTSCDLGAYTLGNNDYTLDPSNDIGVLSNWFQAGGKKAFMTGDDLVFSLQNAGGAGQAFLTTYLNVQLTSNNILPLINNQTAPRVVPMAGNSVFTTADEWIAFGGCLSINDFDAIQTLGGTEQLAQFLTPSGNPGYPYAAATRYTNVADVIVMPYDFSYIYNPTDFVPSQPGFTARAEVLRDVLVEFGHIPGPTVIGVPDGNLVFGVANYPNPFNPATEIKLTVPKAGHVSLKVFNVRGELVRTLVNGELAAGPQSIMWNGTNDSGSGVASGVYFYETKYNDETLINKMALVK